MKYLIAILLIGLRTTIAQSVNRGDLTTILNTDTLKSVQGPFYLPDFQINPKTKTVSLRGIGGKGEIGEEIIYTQDDRIKYDSSVLVILGQHILFKEYFPKNCNLDHIKVLSSNQYATIFRCDNSIYTADENGVSKGINISGYQIVDNSFFVNKAEDVYYLGNNHLEKITGLHKLDTGSLKHLSWLYCSDKKGLYFINSHNNKNYQVVNELVQVEASNGRKINPIVTKNYIVYNKHVYSISDKIFRLDLNVSNMREIEWSEDYSYSIFDNKNLYEKQRYPYTAQDRVAEVNALNFFENRKIRLLYVFPSYVNFITAKDTNELYLPLGKDKYEHTHGSETFRQGILIYTSDGYYFLDQWLNTISPQKISKVLVYNVDTRKSENFDIKQFRFIKYHLFIYKNHAFYEYMLLKDTLDLKKLVCLSSKTIQTNYIADGKTLINLDSFGHTGYKDHGIEYVSLSNIILKNSDLSKIRIVNKDVLTDGKNIYFGRSIIPINELGMRVKVIQ